jgi:hypothetical protein
MPPIDKIIFLQTEVIMVKGRFIDMAKIVDGELTDRIIALTSMGGSQVIFENADWQGETIEPAMGFQLDGATFKGLSDYLRERLKPQEEWP